MDAATIQTWLSIIKDIVTILAAGVAAYVGIIGLQTWQRQLRGNAEYDLARRVLVAVYRVRDAIRYFRFPMDETSELEKLKELHEVQFTRLQDARGALEIELLEAEAVWGDDGSYRLSFSVFTSLWYKVYFAYMAYYSPDITDPNLKKENHKILFSSLTSSEDKFENDLEKAVTKIEDLLRPKLRLKQAKSKKRYWWDRFKKTGRSVRNDTKIRPR